jgi:spore coat protein CotH
MNFNSKFLFVFCMLSLPFFQSKAQFLITPKTPFTYFAAISEPDASWNTYSFDDSSWSKDSILVGFGYNNDSVVYTLNNDFWKEILDRKKITNYTQINSSVNSLYLRYSFNIENVNNTKSLNFIADYDDGFIAYLNGKEIARVNIDKSIANPPFNAVASRSHASEYIMQLTKPVLGIFLDSTVLAGCLVNGENILAVHVINDSIGNDLIFIPLLEDLTNSYYNVWGFDSRYKRLIDVDSTNLPLVVIETDQYGIAYDQSIWTTAKMGIVNNGEGKFNKPSDPYNEYNGLISIRARGQSSRDFAKKSYRFELVDGNASDTSFALMGMPKESDWVLFGPYTDKSQIRNKFAYDLASRMGQYAPRTRFCELVINGQLEGLYLLTEQIKRGKNRVNVSKLKDTDISGNDVTGGYIFKYDKTDQNMKWMTNGREIVYPDVLMDEQKSYLQNLFTVYDSVLTKSNDFLDPVKGFRKYASDSSLVDFIIINEITKNADAYLYSTYMYKDRDDKDGRIKFGPMWDCDLAFGNSMYQDGNKIDIWQFAYYSLKNSQNVMKIQRYFEDTQFVALFQKRYHELRAKTYSNDSILSFLDELVQQVKLVRERNYKVWPLIDKVLFGPGYYVDSYENEIATMKNWVTDRMAWLDANVDKIYYPLERVGDKQLELVAEKINLKIFPNPFESELSINFNLEKESNVCIELYGLTGQLQYQKRWESVRGIVDFVWNDSKLTSLKSGLYLAKVFVNGMPCPSLKIIKK